MSVFVSTLTHHFIGRNSSACLASTVVFVLDRKAANRASNRSIDHPCMPTSRADYLTHQSSMVVLPDSSVMVVVVVRVSVVLTVLGLLWFRSALEFMPSASTLDS